MVAAVECVFQAEAYRDQLHVNKDYYMYVRIMAALDWPAYINGDTSFHQRILKCYEEEDLEGLEAEIYDFYDAQYLKDLEDRISGLNVIKIDRLPLIREALLLYQLGYYYGTVAVLITQILGITADIKKYLEKNNNSYSGETLELIKKRYGLNNQNDMSRVMTAVVESKLVDDEQNEYDFFLGYLRFIVFGNRVGPEETEKHVNRHMVCHGAQLNYGTKEHALKTILCVDSLVWVAEVIYSNIDE